MSDRESQQASIDASEASLPAENGSQRQRQFFVPCLRLFPNFFLLGLASFLTS